MSNKKHTVYLEVPAAVAPTDESTVPYAAFYVQLLRNNLPLAATDSRDAVKELDEKLKDAADHDKLELSGAAHGLLVSAIQAFLVQCREKGNWTLPLVYDSFVDATVRASATKPKGWDDAPANGKTDAPVEEASAN